MRFSIVSVLSLVSVTSSSIIPRADPGFQNIPANGITDNTCSNGKPILIGEPDQTNQIPPAVYGARSVDLPFGRLYHGSMKFFAPGQYNTPDDITDKWIPGVNDFANQSACGIPDNAFYNSKVAIHPYFLKYADLSRYCMQDVCISFWKEDGSSDMMLKVTDICSTDPNDPTHCATPGDIKIDRAKAQVMEGFGNTAIKNVPDLMGNEYPGKIYWFFAKCWADGLAQPAYQGVADNWFTTPALPNNLQWAQDQATLQYEANQKAYQSKGWPAYPNGAYNTARAENCPEISDWVPGAEPAWKPIAGGKGWGLPKGGQPAIASASYAAASVSSASSLSTSAFASLVASSTSVAYSATAPSSASNSASSLNASMATTSSSAIDSSASSTECAAPSSASASSSPSALSPSISYGPSASSSASSASTTSQALEEASFGSSQSYTSASTDAPSRSYSHPHESPKSTSTAMPTSTAAADSGATDGDCEMVWVYQ